MAKKAMATIVYFITFARNETNCNLTLFTRYRLWFIINQRWARQFCCWQTHFLCIRNQLASFWKSRRNIFLLLLAYNNHRAKCVHCNFEYWYLVVVGFVCCCMHVNNWNLIDRKDTVQRKAFTAGNSRTQRAQFTMTMLLNIRIQMQWFPGNLLKYIEFESVRETSSSLWI